jgi:iron complex transport system substrate-binding protein
MSTHPVSSRIAQRLHRVAVLLFASMIAHAANATDAAPQRVVAVGGATTEILYALGLADRVVGVDSTSLFPPQALRDKPNVGYMRQLSAEGILGLSPQLVLLGAGSGPKETLAVLAESGVALRPLPDHFSGEGIIERIRAVAAAMGVPARGACLETAVRGDLAALADLRGRIGAPRRVLFVMSLVDGRALVAGRGTAADAVIALGGGINAASDVEGYKPFGDEAVLLAQPDLVLTMQRGAQEVEAPAVFSRPGFAQTPAGARRAFLSLDGHLLLGFGPRTPEAARAIAAALDPAAAAAPWPAQVAAASCASP